MAYLSFTVHSGKPLFCNCLYAAPYKQMHSVFFLHDMGGLSPEEQNAWVDMGLNYWLDNEDAFNKEAHEFSK